MNTDTYFEIGATHEVCQDFALAGQLNDKLAFAIVTDGCTDAHVQCGEVDFGARVLAYSAREALFDIFLTNHELAADANVFNVCGTILRETTLVNLAPVKKQFSLSELFSDATLVVAIFDGKNAYAYMYGDGGILVKDKEGNLIYDEITFTSSAPYYLIYDNPDRNKNYGREYGKHPVYRTNAFIPKPKDGVNAVNIKSSQHPFLGQVVDESVYKFSSFMYQDVANISVTSDGIKSFQQITSEGVKNIPSVDMVPRFVGFKNVNGCFQQRRMKFLQKECQQGAITHFDDISIASIVT